MGGLSLDRQSFKVLASDTRVNILKRLGKRRMTLSELSKSFGMSVSTIKEHLDNLSNAGLVDKKDEGRKWKYYELTGKGEGLVKPVRTQFYIVLGFSLLLMFTSVYGIIGRVSEPVMVKGGMLASPVPESSVQEARVLSAPSPENNLFLDYALLFQAGMIISTLIIGLSIGYWLGRKRSVL
ncbi:MAG: winged helix-turn-helix transcriptional regulator [Nanoarchaeota archaeon]|nr:winged helix-turn-helix transcriptional regulator [Nanoarchaeota archaeon]